MSSSHNHRCRNRRQPRGWRSLVACVQSMSLFDLLARPLLSVLALVMALGLVGCAPDGPVYETPNMRIVTDFDEPLCAGNLEDLEGFINGVEQTLGVEMAAPVDVYLWSRRDRRYLPGCPDDAAGCYHPITHTIYATSDTVYHELVHATVASLGGSREFWVEGIAEAMDPQLIRFLGTDPGVEVKYHRRDHAFDAAHFTRWLLDTYGVTLWRQLYASRGSERDFARIYGMSFSEARDEYLETSMWIYAKLYRRALPELPAAEVGWRDEVDFDCSSNDAFGYPESISVLRVLDLEESGYYDIWTSADGVTLRRRMKNSIGSKEEAEEAGESDVPASTASIPLGMAVLVPGGTLGVLQLDADEYEVAVVDLDRDLERATVIVVPHLGPLEQVPKEL